MIKKLIISIVIIYFLALVQTSFMVHFSFWGMVPNVFLLFIIIWNVIEKPENSLGLYNAILAGFFSDIFSTRFIGFNVLIFLAIAIILKFLFKRYVRIPFIKEA